ERLEGERHHLAVAQQPPLAGVEKEGTERVREILRLRHGDSPQISMAPSELRSERGQLVDSERALDLRDLPDDALVAFLAQDLRLLALEGFAEPLVLVFRHEIAEGRKQHRVL